MLHSSAPTTFKLHQVQHAGAHSKSVNHFHSSKTNCSYQDFTFLTNNHASCLPAVSAAGTQQPFHFLPQPRGPPRPSLAHLCHATMLPRAGGCCHVRHTLAAWHGTASTSWACCHGPITATRQHTSPCRRHVWQSDMQATRDHHHQLWRVPVETAKQLWTPHAWSTPGLGWRWPASERGLSFGQNPLIWMDVDNQETLYNRC